MFANLNAHDFEKLLDMRIVLLKGLLGSSSDRPGRAQVEENLRLVDEEIDRRERGLTEQNTEVRTRWEFHLLHDDSRDLEIMVPAEEWATEAQIEAVIAVLTGQWREIHPEKETAAREVLVRMLTAPSAVPEED